MKVPAKMLDQYLSEKKDKLIIRTPLHGVKIVIHLGDFHKYDSKLASLQLSGDISAIGKLIADGLLVVED